MKLQTQKLLAAAVVLISAVFAVVFPGGAGIVLAQETAGPATASRSAPTHPFEPGEELVYVAEFSRALLKNIDVADFRFTARREPAAQKVNDPRFIQDKGRAPYLLKLTGDVSSKGFFSKVFNLRFREQIESTVEPVAFSVTRTKKIDEQGKRARVSETTYDNGRVRWIEHDTNNPTATAREANAPFAGQVQDLLSAIYYLRTQPLEIGKSFEVTVSDSGRVYQVPVQVVEKKRKKTVLGRVETIRVDPQVFGPNRMVSGEGQFSVWLTNDSRRIPVSARIKMKYGTFDITLRKIIQNPSQQSLASNVAK
ncbi:MAG TPA: DUF3108 domain-containing protein [Pyrinomonadaceae bacterium]|jgi:hypothetical protein|nr:DUF3108 domain-containing protein [Pyrinomonadaceae bacterium]